jgi:hypothetical protein
MGATRGPLPGRLDGVLSERRRRRFVGREAELDLFAQALRLDRAEPDFAVLHIHGAGGIGKTTLMREYRRLADQAGRPVIWVDAGTPSPSPVSEGQEAEQAGAPQAQALAVMTGDHVAFIDDLHKNPRFEYWLREQGLPQLPTGALVVLAGRTALSDAWHADPGWRDLLRSFALRNLDPSDATSYALAEGLAPGVGEQIARLTHGHPLAVSLLVDAVRRAESPGRLPETLQQAPDLVRALMGHLIEESTDPIRRRGLHVLAQALATTEELLLAVSGDKPAEVSRHASVEQAQRVEHAEQAARLFDRLRALTFVEPAAQGLRPHDLARDVLDADLRWRDRRSHDEIHRRIRNHFLSRLREDSASEADRQHTAEQVLFLLRRHPVLGARWSWDQLGRGHVEPARPSDFASLIEMTEARHGAAQAEAVGHWTVHQPGAFGVFRGDDGRTLGYGAYLDLTGVSEDVIGEDPGTSAVWNHVLARRPPTPGERVKVWRFLVEPGAADEEGAQRVGTLLGAWHLREILRGPAAGWDFVATYTDLDRWEPFMRHVDFHHLPEADFRIGGRRFVVFGHDWRSVGVEEWLDLTLAHELGEPPATEPAHTTALSRAEFQAAVKEALRDLHDPLKLAANPLNGTALVRRSGTPSSGTSDEGVLHGLVLWAAQMVRDNPRTEHFYRVIDRTWLRPAPTQEAAARMLDLAFSTYRRHRDRGAELLAEQLWQCELRPDSAAGRGGAPGPSR